MTAGSRIAPSRKPKALIDIRRHRLRLIAAVGDPNLAREENNQYVDEEAVRAELRSITTTAPAQAAKIGTRNDDEGEEDDDEDDDGNRPPPPPLPKSSPIPRNAFGRAEDEITSDFALPGMEGRPRPRASEPPAAPQPGSGAGATVNAPQVWQPLSDDEATGEALLSSLKRAENASEGEPGPGGPGLN